VRDRGTDEVVADYCWRDGMIIPRRLCPASADTMTNRDLVLASFRTALVVGTILTLLNQWELIQSGSLDRAFAVKALLNCLVPFSVSLYSRWSTVRRPAPTPSARS